jgi:hypothetical protein
MSELEKAARMALEAMGLIGADLVCDAAHHKKADRHGIGEPCPIQARWHHAFAALRQALSDSVEQPAQQEPIAWVDLLKEAEQIVRGKFLWKKFIDGTPLANDIPCWMADFAQQYTNPQQKREWVGLTDEEIHDIYDEVARREPYNMAVTRRNIARAIEANLKEKNS